VKKSRKFVNSAIAIFALLVLTVAVWRVGEISRHASASGAADPMTPVPIVLKGSYTERSVTLRVPPAYLKRAEGSRGGQQEIVSVRAALPNMEPEPRYPDIRGTDPTAVDPALLAILNNAIDISIGPPLIPGRISDFAAKRNQLTSSPYLRLMESDNYGLIRADDITCTPELRAAIARSKNADLQCVPSSYSHFVTRESDMVSVWITCLPETSFRFGCIAYSSCSGLRVDFVFRRSQISQWRYIQGSVCSLVDRFVSPDESSGPVDE
jgi:hypothetical protein